MVSNDGAMPQPTKTELSILNILWDNGPSTVREVHDTMNRSEASGYTTALKMLQVMHQKGQVVRNDSQRAHIYSAAVSKDETQSQFLTDLVDRLFDGSTSQLVMQALGNAPKAEDEELERIRELIAKFEE